MKIKQLLPENLEQDNEIPDPEYDEQIELDNDPGYQDWLSDYPEEPK